jgi:hypothetical protein
MGTDYTDEVARFSDELDLTRFRGHFMFTKKGDQDGKDTQAIHAGVPAADGAAASIGAEI